METHTKVHHDTIMHVHAKYKQKHNLNQTLIINNMYILKSEADISRNQSCLTIVTHNLYSNIACMQNATQKNSYFDEGWLGFVSN